MNKVKLNIPKMMADITYGSPIIGDSFCIVRHSVLIKNFVGKYEITEIHHTDVDDYMIAKGEDGNTIRVTVRNSGLMLISRDSGSEVDIIDHDYIDYFRQGNPEKCWFNADGGYFRVGTSVVEKKDPPEEGFELWVDMVISGDVRKDGEIIHRGQDFEVIAVTETYAMTSVTIHNDLYGSFDLYPGKPTAVHGAGVYDVVPKFIKGV